MNHFVYILECADKTLYVGCTNNLEKRLKQHNESKYGAHYTKIRRPVKLLYSETFGTLNKARGREAELKKWKRAKKVELIKKKEMKRCSWPKNSTALMMEYHDKEWGVPVHNDNRLFEVLILDGAQAGLSWNTILNKRENYRKAFDNFNVKKVAKYDAKKIRELMKDEGIVRNRLKIASAVRNAKIFVEIQKEFGTFDVYIWGFVDGKPIKNKWKRISDIPASTKLSNTISKDLKRRGMNFVGSTIIYAIMQTIGVVNDHEVGCFRYSKI